MKNSTLLLASAMAFAAAAGYAATPAPSMPIIYVNTENNQEITTKEYYLKATYWLDNNGDAEIESLGSQDAPLETEIKARGNYSWTGFDKKPYKLKLSKKTELMGMDKNKHFALMARADDNLGFMRDQAGFALSQRFGLTWTPMVRPVQFYLNGDFKGLYFLTQTIRVDNTRVDIIEQADNATDNVTGGWLVEIDNYDTDPHVTIQEPTGYPIWFTYKSPEILSAEQETYLTSQMDALNKAIYAEDKNSTEWEKYLDIDMAVRYYIVQEIMDDCESYHGSCYLYKNQGDDTKWMFGPVWDFGNAFQRGEKSKFIWQDPTFNQVWIGELYKFPRFQQRVKEIWKEFCEEGYDGVIDHLTNFAKDIEPAARVNYEIWPQYGNEDVIAKNNQILSYIKKSIKWLGDQWGAQPIEAEGPTELYVRGEYNGWGASDQLTYEGEGVYSLMNPSFSGHFKIAADTWDDTAHIYGAPQSNMTPEINKPFTITIPGENIIAPAGINECKMVLDTENLTLLFTDGTAIENVEVNADEVQEIYTVTGQRVNNADGHGVYIYKYTDRTVKVMK